MSTKWTPTIEQVQTAANKIDEQVLGIRLSNSERVRIAYFMLLHARELFEVDSFEERIRNERREAVEDERESAAYAESHSEF